MGGIVVQSEHFPEPTPIGPAFVLMLAREGHFLRVESAKIDDKSKANLFQKILVVTQVSWMVLQCSARKIYGFPLSLLEVHTLVHVFCAFILYALWIKVCESHGHRETRPGAMLMYSDRSHSMSSNPKLSTPSRLTLPPSLLLRSNLTMFGNSTT